MKFWSFTSVAVHRHVLDWLGSTSARPNGCGDLVSSEGGTSYHCLRNDGNTVGLLSFSR